MFKIRYTYVCHRGKKRKINQDNIVCRDVFLPMAGEKAIRPVSGEEPLKNQMLFGVFDGMGGEQRGEVASYTAAQTAAGWKLASGKETLNALCRDINRRICAYSVDHKLNTCGTTAAMLLFDREKVDGCNLGDSRIYLCKQNTLAQLSEDHVLPAFQNSKPPLLQFLGIPETEMIIEPSFFSRKIAPGDVYLICSDGLTDMLTEEQILQMLLAQDSMEKSTDHMLDAALLAGGKDNISFIIIRIDSCPDTAPVPG